jgi:hypothetical protein
VEHPSLTVPGWERGTLVPESYLSPRLTSMLPDDLSTRTHSRCSPSVRPATPAACPRRRSGPRTWHRHRSRSEAPNRAARSRSGRQTDRKRKLVRVAAQHDDLPPAPRSGLDERRRNPAEGGLPVGARARHRDHRQRAVN